MTSMREQIIQDYLIYGIAITRLVWRKWYNPLRWILGKEYIQHIRPKDFWRR